MQKTEVQILYVGNLANHIIWTKIFILYTYKQKCRTKVEVVRLFCRFVVIVVATFAQKLGSKHFEFWWRIQMLKIVANSDFIPLGLFYKMAKRKKNTQNAQIHKKNELQMILHYGDYVLFATHRLSRLQL